MDDIDNFYFGFGSVSPDSLKFPEQYSYVREEKPSEKYWILK